jgi:hypothetical protein
VDANGATVMKGIRGKDWASGLDELYDLVELVRDEQKNGKANELGARLLPVPVPPPAPPAGAPTATAPATVIIVSPATTGASAPAAPTTAGTDVAGATAAAATEDALEVQLARFKRLRDKDLITDDEYSAKKKQLLGI